MVDRAQQGLGLMHELTARCMDGSLGVGEIKRACGGDVLAVDIRE